MQWRRDVVTGSIVSPLRYEDSYRVKFRRRSAWNVMETRSGYQAYRLSAAL